jgi:hypothetical protein
LAGAFPTLPYVFGYTTSPSPQPIHRFATLAILIHHAIAEDGDTGEQTNTKQANNRGMFSRLRLDVDRALGAAL